MLIKRLYQYFNVGMIDMMMNSGSAQAVSKISNVANIKSLERILIPRGCSCEFRF